MFHFHTYLGKCHQLGFYTIPPGIERSQGQKSRLSFSVGEDFSDTAFSFRWKDPHDFEMDIMWISWIFLVWKSLFWLEIVEHGEGERESQTHFW